MAISIYFILCFLLYVPWTDFCKFADAFYYIFLVLIFPISRGTRYYWKNLHWMKMQATILPCQENPLALVFLSSLLLSNFHSIKNWILQRRQLLCCRAVHWISLLKGNIRVHIRTFLESKMLKDFCLNLLYNLFSSHQKFGKKEVAK